MLFQALSRVSCTRSSARSTLPHKETAKARRFGTRRSIASFSGGDASLTGTSPLVSSAASSSMKRSRHRLGGNVGKDVAQQAPDLGLDRAVQHAG